MPLSLLISVLFVWLYLAARNLRLIPPFQIRLRDFSSIVPFTRFAAVKGNKISKHIFLKHIIVQKEFFSHRKLILNAILFQRTLAFQRILSFKLQFFQKDIILQKTFYVKGYSFLKGHYFSKDICYQMVFFQRTVIFKFHSLKGH